MPTAEELSRGRHQMAAALAVGLDTLSENQVITFTKYVRVVLPVDGSTFWVKADIASPSAILNAMKMNAAQFNQERVTSGENVFQAKGSIHYMSESNQNEDDSDTVNQIVFTSQVEVENLNNVGPFIMYLGEWQGVRFSFSRREMFYEQAKLYHYAGAAVLTVMSGQIIDAPVEFSPAQVVSDSLPIWLNMANPYIPIIGLGGIGFPIFPSFLVDANFRPPYISVHIPPDSTRAIGLAPKIDRQSNHSQLVYERVKITTYGLRNREVLDLLDYILAYSDVSDIIGISNSPVPRDEKEGQIELGVLAMRKTIDFEVNYYQHVTRDISRQLIESVFASYAVTGGGSYGRWNQFRWNDGTVWK
jgi:hypothetical protein